jgi:hypothetical protein
MLVENVVDGRIVQTEVPDLTVQELIRQGYKQTSRRYRTLARLPPGKTGIEAVVEARDADLIARTKPEDKLGVPPFGNLRETWHANHVKWANMIGEKQAGDHFRRIHATPYGLSVIVSDSLLRAFRASGGESA